MYECDVFCPLSVCLAIGSEMRLADAKQPLHVEMHSLAPELVPKKKRMGALGCPNATAANQVFHNHANNMKNLRGRMER